MPKRSRTHSFITGLTSHIIQSKAATNSFERGQQIFSDDLVTIDSFSSGSVEASISGKHYDITINFEDSVSSSLDIDCDCSCPDDRDGACKHCCAVLFKLMDPQPKSKKNKMNSNSKKKNATNYTVAQLKEAVKHMDHDHLTDVLHDALQYAGVQNIVRKKLNSIGNEQVDIGHYKGEIYEAIHQFDRLRPSQQFSMAHKVHQDLSEIIDSAEKYFKRGNNESAMEILIAIGNSVSNERNIEGEIWKSLHGCSGFDSSVAELMIEILNSDSKMKQKESIMNAIRSIHQTLSAYGVDDYQEVLQCFET